MAWMLRAFMENIFEFHQLGHRDGFLNDYSYSR